MMAADQFLWFRKPGIMGIIHHSVVFRFSEPRSQSPGQYIDRFCSFFFSFLIPWTHHPTELHVAAEGAVAQENIHSVALTNYCQI